MSKHDESAQRRPSRSLSASRFIEARATYYVQYGPLAMAPLSSLTMPVLPPINDSESLSLPGMIYVLLTAVCHPAGRWSRRALAQVT
ncbi:hypothetical protein ACFFJT_02520 [Dyella flava]|uniref:Uncharacterized protein n=1 Tax=Dyella flava TaxID=1920170 RepID=A0ABS2K5G3_9GAMM|nr:hypothetical protein [Dyella flava]MBM7126124.1 hypothetical protein [Dyella flava]